MEITDLKSLPGETCLSILFNLLPTMLLHILASNLVVGGHRDSLRDSGRHSAQPNDLEAEVGVSGDSNEAESDRHFLRKKDQQGRTNEVILPNGSLPHGFSQFNRSSARKSRFTDKWLEAADRIEEDYQLKVEIILARRKNDFTSSGLPFFLAVW